MIRSNLKSVMNNKKITAQEIHNRTGISRNTLRLLTLNKSKGIQFDTLDELLNVLDCSIEDLFIHIPGDLKVSVDFIEGDVYLKYSTGKVSEKIKIEYEIDSYTIQLKESEEFVEAVYRFMNYSPGIIEIIMYMMILEMIKNKKIPEASDVAIVEHEFISRIKTLDRYDETFVSLKDGKFNSLIMFHYLQKIKKDIEGAEVKFGMTTTGELHITFPDMED